MKANFHIICKCSVILAADFSNSVIVLPRIVPQVHDTGFQRTSAVDPLAWGVPELAAMVRSLSQVSGAATVPGIDEWVILPDKVRACPDGHRLTWF